MKNMKAQKGQGMTEYILIVALIAIAAIAAVRYFGTKTSSSFKQSADTISGNVSSQNSKDGTQAQ
jgi:Flp pilus assembly pilin Flp